MKDKIFGLADKYSAQFNNRFWTEGSGYVLQDLSTQLGKLIDKQYPRSKDGKPVVGAFENQMWAEALIVADWLGWVLESKAILHYGKPHPMDAFMLHQEVSSSIVKALGVGVSRAMIEKGVFNEKKKRKVR